MPPGTIVMLTKEEKKSWSKGGNRKGNSGMGHSCRCWRRPLEAKVYDLTPGGVRPLLVCTPCANKIASKHAV